jgi:hypothetical protein
MMSPKSQADLVKQYQEVESVIGDTSVFVELERLLSLGVSVLDALLEIEQRGIPMDTITAQIKTNKKFKHLKIALKEESLKLKLIKQDNRRNRART